MKQGFPAARLELDRLRSAPVSWSGELAGDARAWGIADGTLLAPPRLEFHAEEAGSGGVRVRGRLEARCGLACRRCLRAMERVVEFAFDFRFDPSVRPWEEEEGVYRLDPDSAVLDLSGPLREELVLALPEYPECPGGCSGLCPVCGEDLDETECGCTREERDPRWDVLKELLPDSQASTAEPDE